jgi:IS30 family transposase
MAQSSQRNEPPQIPGRFIPKKRRMETVTDEVLTMIENRLNDRPRKRLGFKIQYEVFHASLNRVAIRA